MLYDLNSKVINRQSVKTDVAADGVAEDIMTTVIPEGITPVHFIALKLTDERGNEVSRNFYWRSDNKFEGPWTLTGPTTAGFQPLRDMPAAKVNVSVKKVKNRKYEVTVSNPGKQIAFFLQLQLRDSDGQPVNRTIYNDNFFTLLPGEKRRVELISPKDDIGESIRLSGWNIKEENKKI